MSGGAGLAHARWGMLSGVPRRAAPDPTRVFRSRASPGVEAYEACWRCDASPLHVHPQFQVTLGLAGEGQVRHRGEERRARAGAPFVFLPGEPHAIAPAGRAPWRFVSLYVPVALVDAAAAPRQTPRGGATAVAFVEPFRDTVLTAFRAVRDGTEARSGALGTLAALLARERDAAPPSAAIERDAQILAARAYLLARLDRRVAVAELACAVGLTPARLARAYSAAFGLSLHAFHLQARVHRAKELVAGGAALSEVAVATGFTDQSHLARHFARLQGLPPGRWARGDRNVQDGP